ncbi:MAG: hypothetical protein HWD61_02370 [Parachlamydiaceae bacterium]|nr:MAG: hypothetical protein HWD61_02370 [Parachlamydiaceae bacterium]
MIQFNLRHQDKKYHDYLWHRAQIAHKQLVINSIEDEIEAEFQYEKQKLFAQLDAHPEKTSFK